MTRRGLSFHWGEFFCRMLPDSFRSLKPTNETRKVQSSMPCFSSLAENPARRSSSAEYPDKRLGRASTCQKTPKPMVSAERWLPRSLLGDLLLEFSQPLPPSLWRADTGMLAFLKSCDTTSSYQYRTDAQVSLGKVIV